MERAVRLMAVFPTVLAAILAVIEAARKPQVPPPTA